MLTPKGEINGKIFKLMNDEEMLKKMQDAKSPEACYDIVKGKIDISFEDFKQSMSIGNEYLKEKESGLLSEEDLDQVAGGKSQEQKDEGAETGIMLGTAAATVGVGVGVYVASAAASAAV